MELTAFMNWLLTCDDPLNRLIYEARQQNPQVVDILELAGDATYDRETFVKAIDKLKELKEAETKAIPVELLVMPKNADKLKELMIAADSMLTLFAFSTHIFLQKDKLEERKKEAQRIGFGLRKLKESIFSA